jgi:hypothetical protein
VNRAALFAAVSDWSARNDLTPGLLTSFLALAEQRIYFGSPEVEPLRHYRMLTTVNPSVTFDALAGMFDSQGQPMGEYTAPLPADFLDVERVTSEHGGRRFVIEYRSTARMAEGESMGGLGAYFGIRGSSLVFAPEPAGAVSLLYYARPATPVLDADENWIMQTASGVYLSAMLIEVGEWMRDEAMVAEQKAKYMTSAGALQRSGDRTQSGSMSQLRITTK